MNKLLQMLQFPYNSTATIILITHYMLSTMTLGNNRAIRPTQQHMFINITQGSDHYRLLTKQCKQTMNALNNLRIYWGIVAFIQFAAIFDHLGVLKQGSFVFGAAFLGVFVATLLAFANRKQLINLLLYSLVNLSIFLGISTILLILDIKQLIIPTLIYITIQGGLSIVFLQHRHKLMPKFLVLLQLFLVMLKLDNKIQSQWIEVQFGFLLTFFVAIVVMVSMLIFWIVDTLGFRERICSVKHIGLIFVIWNCASATMLSMVVLAQQFFKIQLMLVSIIGISVNMMTIGYSTRFQTQLILFLCKVQKIKAFNQLITLIKIKNTITDSFIFVRKSENWYERILIEEFQVKCIKQKQFQLQEKQNEVKNNLKQLSYSEESKKQIQDFLQPKSQQIDNKQQQTNICVICLQLQACIVWMPCGHLTVCQICCDKMLQSKCCNCLLCKNIPQAIYHIDTDQPKTETQTQFTKFNIRSKKKIRQASTKDLDQIQQSISGNMSLYNSQKNINERQVKLRQLVNKYKKGEIYKIRAAYSIKIN